MRVVRCDGSPDAVRELVDELTHVLDGVGSVLPLAPADPPELPPDLPDPGPGTVVVRTSGSTGTPRHVVLDAAALRASATATHERLGGPGRWLLALPAHHVAGLQVLVRSILADAAPALLDLRCGFDPAEFATHAAGCRYTSVVPTQLGRLLDTAPAALTGFDAVLVGGAAAPPTLLARARAAGVPVVTTYGMTETAGGCVYDGRPLAGVQVRLSAAGLVEIGGPMLARGYLGGDPFPGGWFRTSDLGEIGADGRLRVLGRADDVIVTGGVNVAPAAVEAVLEDHPGVSAACVLGVPDPVWGHRVVAAVVPVDPGVGPGFAAEVLAAARTRLTGAQLPKELTVLSALPRLGIGKVDRRATAELLDPERSDSPG